MVHRSARSLIYLTTFLSVLFFGVAPFAGAAPADPPLMVSAPTQAEADAVGTWYEQHIQRKFHAGEAVSVSLLNGPEMTIYLDGDAQDGSADSSNGDIDGVFENDPPSITLRLPPSGAPDTMTFAHEYGHYVWFDLLTDNDRDHYRAIYNRQKADHRLITDYAADSVEEGFAEAFSFYVARPTDLKQRDARSYQFLARWPRG